MDLICPKCSRSLKSKSALSLHVNRCCPEFRYRQTRIQFTVDVVVPIAFDAAEQYLEVVPAGPFQMFQELFREETFSSAGPARLITITSSTPVTTLRSPTQSEIYDTRAKEKKRDRDQKLNEQKRIIREVFGKSIEKYKIRMDKCYRMGLEQNRWVLVPNGTARGWTLRSPVCSFLFDGVRVLVSYGPRRNSYPFDQLYDKEFSLADPQCFEQIRALLKIQK